MWNYFAVVYLSIIVGCHAFNLEGSTNFAIGLEKLTSVVVVNNFAYYGTNTAPGYVIEFNLTSNVVTRYLQLQTGENYLVSATNYGDCIYFGTATSPGIVIQINTTSFTRLNSISTTGDNNLVSAFTLGTSVYFISSSSLIKINVPTLTYNAKLSLLLGSNQALSSVLYGGYIFIGTTGSTIPYYNVNNDNMQLSGTLTLNANETNIAVAAIWGAYFGVFISQSLNRLFRINLFAKTIDYRMDFSPEFPVKTAVSLSSYSYLGGTKTQYVDCLYWKYLGNFTLGSDPGVTFSYNNNIYYGMNTSPAQVVCVNNTNSGFCGSSLIDSTVNYFSTSIEYNGNGYFVTSSSFSNSIVKIELENLTQSGSLLLNNTENNFFTSFVYKNYGFFGSRNGMLLKIDLDSLQRETSLVLGNSIGCAVVNDSIAYIGVDNMLLKIDLTSLTVYENISFVSPVQVVAMNGSYAYVGGPNFLSQVNSRSYFSLTKIRWT